MRETTSDRVAVAALGGLCGPVVAGLAILAAALLAGDFSVTGQALSDLGVTPGAAPVFNWGLVAGGLLGLPFPVALWWAARDPLQRAGAVALALALALLVGVGLFPSDTGLHTPVAVGFFLAFSYAMWLHGTGTVRAGEPGRGLTVVWLGLLHVTAWLAWAATGIEGLALPELAGSVLLGTWTVSGARRLRRRRPR